MGNALSHHGHATTTVKRVCTHVARGRKNTARVVRKQYPYWQMPQEGHCLCRYVIQSVADIASATTLQYLYHAIEPWQRWRHVKKCTVLVYFYLLDVLFCFVFPCLPISLCLLFSSSAPCLSPIWIPFRHVL